jgi:hypothetical protein
MRLLHEPTHLFGKSFRDTVGSRGIAGVNIIKRQIVGWSFTFEHSQSIYTAQEDKPPDRDLCANREDIPCPLQVHCHYLFGALMG